MSQRDGINSLKQRLSQQLANGLRPSPQRVSAPSGRELAAAVKRGDITGPQAAGIRLLASVRAPVPVSFRSNLQDSASGASEQALIRKLAPEAVSVRGKDPFDVAFTTLRDAYATTHDPKFYKAAQQLLDSRAKSMREFFDGWAESMRRNAELDKKASIRSRKSARAEKTISLVRDKFNAYLGKLGAGSDQLIPATVQTTLHSGGARASKTLRSSSRADRRAEVQATDSFELAGASPGDDASPTRALEKPEAGVGVQTGRPRNRFYQLNNA